MLIRKIFPLFIIIIMITSGCGLGSKEVSSSKDDEKEMIKVERYRFSTGYEGVVGVFSLVGFIKNMSDHDLDRIQVALKIYKDNNVVDTVNDNISLMSNESGIII
jgi:hypothetical protein